MRSFLFPLAIASVGSVNAHYIFPEVFHNGIDYGHWEFVRAYGDPQYHWGPYGDDIGPLYIHNKTDIQTNHLRCGLDAKFANKTLSVNAGDTLGFYVNYKAYADANPDYPTYQKGIFHPGPLTVYMGRVPEGKTAMNWEGDGQSWFKIYEDFPTRKNDRPRWPNTEVQKLPFVIPKNVPDGDYLFRIEHLNVDSIGPIPNEFEAQFYIACAQISVSGGGQGTPGPMTSIPGAYDYDDPILHESTHSPKMSSGEEMAWDKRTLGPAVWNGS